MRQISYTRVPHIMKQQNEAETAFLAEFAQGEYTINNPLVKLNAYLICPLTAVIMFRTSVKTEVTVTVLGKEEAGDISHTFPAEKEHILPIYGLYADYENKVELKLSTGNKQVVIIKTAPLNEGVVEANKIITTADYFGDNLMFLTAGMNAMPTGYDYRGEIRWYATYNFAFDLKRLENGHILIGSERLVKMPYFTSGLYEMAFSGKIFKEYLIPGGYHHDQIEMEDGNILTLTFDFYSGTVEDVIILLDRNTGKVLKKWDMKDVLPQYPVAGSGTQNAEDWFHNNAIWYDKKTNSLTISGRHQDVIVNRDFETGKINWMIGDRNNWPEEYHKYFFKNVTEGDFDWQYEQHACLVCPDGDVMCFDNGRYRSKFKENYRLNKDNFSRGVRYNINTEKMEIKQVWQYGKERGAEFFSPYISNVEYYDEGHYMVHSGGIGYEDGKTCEGMAVKKIKDPKFNKDHVYTLNSITCELKDDVLMYELQVPANCYRAEKLPLYYANETIELGEGIHLGALTETRTSKMKMRATETGELIPERFKAKLIEEDDRINFNGYFEEGILAQVLLISESGEVLRYQIDTAPKNYGAMCVGTFQKNDSREVDTFINKANLIGKYEVKLLVEMQENDCKIFETGIVISA